MASEKGTNGNIQSQTRKFVTYCGAFLVERNNLQNENLSGRARWNRHVYLDVYRHMALPLGEAGIEEIPNESAVLSAMQSTSANRPVFIFPGPGWQKCKSNRKRTGDETHE